MNGNSIKHFCLPFEIQIMVEGGGHETLHAAKMAQNGKNPFLSQKSQYLFLLLYYTLRCNNSSCIWPGRGFSLVGVSGPLCRWEMGIGAVFRGLGDLEGGFL